MAGKPDCHEDIEEAEPLVTSRLAASFRWAALRCVAKAAALSLLAGGVLGAMLAPVALERPAGRLPEAAGGLAGALDLAAGFEPVASPSGLGAGSPTVTPAPDMGLAATTAATVALAAVATSFESTTRAPITSTEVPTTTPSPTDAETMTPEVCRDTPGWTNGYTACNNYQPVDPDCTEAGVTCHFYQRKPSFCQKGMNRPWQHCCACGGGSTFNGTVPTTTLPSLHLPHVPGMPHWMHMHMPKWESKLAHKFSHKLGRMEQKIEKKVKPIEAAVGEMYDGMNSPDFNQPPKLGGNSIERINSTALNVVLLIAAVTVLGVCLDPCFSPWLAPGRPRLWSIALLLASYGLLIPGLRSIVVSFDIVANIVGHRVNIQPDVTQKTCTESVYGLIDLLHRTGSTTGAGLIFTYAVVVPVAKLLLLTLGELLRFSTSQVAFSISRNSVLFVQHISKWASPDMFAYIFLVHLIRDLNTEPLILTAARLDEGFTCFSVFCVCSTISSLGIGVPKRPSSEDRNRLRAPVLLCCVGRGLAVVVVASLAVAFAVLFAIGLDMPCMVLRIDETRLYPPKGPLPYSAKPVVDALAIPELLRSDISLWRCMVFLAGEITSGEVNSILALTLWAVFVVAFTVIDMVLLTLAALRLRWPAATVPGRGATHCGGRGCGPGLLSPCPFMSVARVLRKLSMLDVSLMGVLVMCFSLQMYAKDGIVVYWERGIFVLGTAEAIHALTYLLVSGAVEHAMTQDTLLAESAAEPDAPTTCGPGPGCGCFNKPPRDLEDNEDDPSVPKHMFGWTCCTAKTLQAPTAEAVKWSPPSAAPVPKRRLLS